VLLVTALFDNVL